MLRKSVAGYMDDIMHLKDIEAVIKLEKRDDFWRHDMWDNCQKIYERVGYQIFSYRGRLWRVDDDRRSIIEVQSGE